MVRGPTSVHDLDANACLLAGQHHTDRSLHGPVARSPSKRGFEAPLATPSNASGAADGCGQQKVVMGGIQHIEIEMNRHPLGTRGSQPGEDRFSGCRNVLRANMGKPMLLDEARLERRRLGQSDIQNAAWFSGRE